METTGGFPVGSAPRIDLIPHGRDLRVVRNGVQLGTLRYRLASRALRAVPRPVRGDGTPRGDSWRSPSEARHAVEQGLSRIAERIARADDARVARLAERHYRRTSLEQGYALPCHCGRYGPPGTDRCERHAERAS